MRQVGGVRCGRVSRREPHPPHRFVFQAEDDSPEEVEADCPGWKAPKTCASCGDDLSRRGPELCPEERDGYHVVPARQWPFNGVASATPRAVPMDGRWKP